MYISFPYPLILLPCYQISVTPLSLRHFVFIISLNSLTFLLLLSTPTAPISYLQILHYLKSKL